MNIAGIRVQPLRVSELIAGIASGAIVLPEFQRDFDWSDEQVGSLVATIVKRWPAGSLLLMEGQQDSIFFKLREFQGAPPRQQRPKWIVLDGQQRLTGLFQAVYDTGDYVYAMRARALRPEASVDELEESTASFKRSTWDADHRERAWDADNDWIPLYALRSPAEYFTWRDATVRGAQISTAEKQQLEIVLADAYRHGLESFHQYDFPAVIVDRDMPAPAVARIFERVNTSGIPLTTFDLMVAKTFREDWNLRDRWEAAIATSSHLEAFFGENGMPALQVVSLRNGTGVRQSDVLLLTPEKVRDHWEDSVAALDQALNFLVDECGVRSPAWLPYTGLLLSLSGAALKGHALASQRALVRAWFFSRTFGLRYEVAANTVTVSEIDVLSSALAGASLSIPRMSEDSVAQATRRRQGAIWRGFLCALAVNLPSGVVLTDQEEELRPVSVLRREDEPPRGREPTHLLALGFVLTSRQGARALANEGADRLRADVRSGVNAPHPGLAQQLMPSAESWGDSDEDFVAARLRVLSEFLEKETGHALVPDPAEPAP